MHNGNDLSNLVQRSDRGVRYLSICYSERLNETEIMASVGSKGDSYDCQTIRVGSVKALFKGELIRQRGPWRTVEQVEWATLNYVD